MIYDHHYNQEGFYTMSLPALPGELPANNATRLSLPALSENECAKFSDEAWAIFPDFYGQYYYSQDGVKHACEQQGVALPDGVLQEDPPDSTYTTHNGIVWVQDIDLKKDQLEDQMSACKNTFCSDGALVTVTVNSTDYTGVFKPLDNGLDSASGVSVTRESDQTLPPSPFDDEWNPRDESGARISIPMTEALMTKIMVYVKNWHTACNKAYVTLEMEMWAMPDVSEFDPVAEMEAALPSRNVTVI